MSARDAGPAVPARAKRPRRTTEGWSGWDEYAPFYDWENAQTLGRRDVPFWRTFTKAVRGPILELGCGTGRVSLPLARAGVHVVGLDRSASMLARASRRAKTGSRRRAGSRTPRPGRLTLVRGDIRDLPFETGEFPMVLAPYGVLQSLLKEADLRRALESVRRVLGPGGQFGIDLVPDVAHWKEYQDRVQLRGRAANHTHLTLIESVHQDRARRLTRFDQVYVEKRAGRRVEHRFTLTFRTLSVRQMTERLERAGFVVDAVLGDYRGRPWDDRADVWLLLARRA